MKTKKFHLGDVLSVITGTIVSPREIRGLHDILTFMSGDKIQIHQMPRVGAECKPYLLVQFPQLAEVDASGVDTDNWTHWLAEQISKYGEELEVRPLPKGAHQFKDPVEEMREMAGAAKKVLVS